MMAMALYFSLLWVWRAWPKRHYHWMPRDPRKSYWAHVLRVLQSGHLFTLLHTVLMWVVYAQKEAMWGLAAELEPLTAEIRGDRRPPQVMTYLTHAVILVSEFAVEENTFKFMLGALVVTSYLRLAEFARLNPRFEVVIVTLLNSACCICTLVVAMAVVIAGYSIAAYVMFSGTHRVFALFSTTVAAMGNLMMGGAGMDMFCREPTCNGPLLRPFPQTPSSSSLLWGRGLVAPPFTQRPPVCGSLPRSAVPCHLGDGVSTPGAPKGKGCTNTSVADWPRAHRLGTLRAYTLFTPVGTPAVTSVAAQGRYASRHSGGPVPRMRLHARPPPSRTRAPDVSRHSGG